MCSPYFLLPNFCFHVYVQKSLFRIVCHAVMSCCHAVMSCCHSFICQVLVLITGTCWTTFVFMYMLKSHSLTLTLYHSLHSHTISLSLSTCWTTFVPAKNWTLFGAIVGLADKLTNIAPKSVQFVLRHPVGPLEVLLAPLCSGLGPFWTNLNITGGFWSLTTTKIQLKMTIFGAFLAFFILKSKMPAGRTVT